MSTAGCERGPQVLRELRWDIGSSRHCSLHEVDGCPMIPTADTTNTNSRCSYPLLLPRLAGLVVHIHLLDLLMTSSAHVGEVVR